MFCLMLRKVVYPYEYMDSLEWFDETSLPKKEDFYSNLNMEDITNTDSKYAKRVWKDFKTSLKNLGEYHDLLVQSGTYSLQMYLKTFERHVLKFINLILLIFYQRLD